MKFLFLSEKKKLYHFVRIFKLNLIVKNSPTKNENINVMLKLSWSWSSIWDLVLLLASYIGLFSLLVSMLPQACSHGYKDVGVLVLTRGSAWWDCSSSDLSGSVSNCLDLNGSCVKCFMFESFSVVRCSLRPSTALEDVCISVYLLCVT